MEFTKFFAGKLWCPVISETSLSRKSAALIKATKLKTIKIKYTRKHKKLILGQRMAGVEKKHKENTHSNLSLSTIVNQTGSSSY